MPFRRALIWIRNQYLDHPKELFLYAIAAFLVTGAVSVLADFLLSWEQWAIFVRAALVVPTAAAIFVLGYSLAIAYVDYRTGRDPDYKSWRIKLSPTMRERVSALLAAVLFVLMFAVAQRPGYTFVASLIVAAAVGLFAFMRRTSDELTREAVGLPDVRDLSLQLHMKEQAKQAANKLTRKQAKEQAKAEKAQETREQIELEKRLEDS